MCLHGLIAHFSLVLNNIPFTGCTTVYSPHEEHLGCFLVFSIMDKATQIFMSMFLCVHKFWVNTKEHNCQIIWQSMFSVLRNSLTVLQSECFLLHSHQQWMRVTVALHPHQHLVLFVFQILAILIHVQWHFVLICIFLMANDVKLLFICSLAIYIS